ncbi:MAG: radical SAM protein, partial [Bdellovibrionales bacterium]|nr:radical SAM protein [Bdellovibrionales bacterium]
NEKGESFSYSAEELMARGLNRWRGWHCTAGVENMYITHDGSIYGSVCREGGFIGNVFEVNFYNRMKYVKCTRRYCTCGTDMALRKFKRLKNRYQAYHITPVEVDEEPERDYVAVQNHYQNEIPPKQVLWDLGRRCNYACSYCPPATSNRYEAHKTLGSLTHAMTNIENSFLKGDVGKFIFGGGEPTMNPDFLDFVKDVHGRVPANSPKENHWIHVTTNGSRLPDYYLELIRYAGLTFSVHFEFYQKPKFLEVIGSLAQAKAKDPNLQWRYIGIRIMVPPGRGGEAQSLIDDLKALPHFDDQAVVNVSPLLEFSPNYEFDFESKMPTSYSAQELALFD